MRQYKLVVFVTLIIGLGLNACQKNVEIEIPYAGDKFIINTQLVARDSVVVRITKSKPITESPINFSLVNDANIVLLENNTPVAQLRRNFINSIVYYTSPYRIKAGASYTVRAKAPELPDAEGTDRVPLAAVVKTSLYNKDNRRISFSIANNPSEKLYYRIRIYSADSSVNTGFVFEKNGFPSQFSIDQKYRGGTGAPGSDNDESAFEYLIDNATGGNELDFNLELTDTYPNTHVFISIDALSEALYRYLRTRNAQEDITGDPFSEYVRVFNNIQNGYGIVGCSNLVEVKVKGR
jgi:Domain of unknown function (DUF4249)